MQNKFLVISSELREAKNNSLFLSGTLAAAGGAQYKFISFNYKGEAFAPGTVVVADYSEDSYNGQTQLKVQSIHQVHDPDFVMQAAKKSTLDIERLFQEIQSTVAAMESAFIRDLLNEILFTKPAICHKFKIAPAATGVHNAWVGGLCEHVWSMMRIAKSLVHHYSSTYNIPVSEDKVLFGVIMHDLGKIMEYDVANPAFPLTPGGVLANHIVTGPLYVYQAATKVRTMDATVYNDTMELIHLIASHHGEIEWGSPVRPATIEAMILHHVDNLDTKVMHSIELATGEEGNIAGFSKWSKIIGTNMKKV